MDSDETPSDFGTYTYKDLVGIQFKLVNSADYYTYDEEWECYVCEQNLDEDEYVRLVEGHYRSCPYYRDGDCYKIARKQ